MPKSRGKVVQPRPLILHKQASSPQKSKVLVPNSFVTHYDKDMSMNNYININGFMDTSSGGANSFVYSANKAHRSPVPIIKASPLTAKEKSFQSKNLKLDKSSVVSSVQLSKMKSAGATAYGGLVPTSFGALQRLNVEKRVSTSASSNKCRESTGSSRNKVKIGPTCTEYSQIRNQKAFVSPGMDTFYHPVKHKPRGKSSNVATRSSLQKNDKIKHLFGSKVEEASGESSDGLTGSSQASGSDYTESDEEVNEAPKEDNTSTMVRKSVGHSAQFKKRDQFDR